MSTAPAVTDLLITGQQMDRTEFIRRWEALPDIKNAELIEGIVYVSSPVSLEHGDLTARVSGIFSTYKYATPGCQVSDNATWYMLDNAPQPDVHLRIRPECGGQSTEERNKLFGAPELAVEVSFTSTEIDFGPKLALYQRAGVQEYVTIETLNRRLIWRMLVEGSYSTLASDPDGIIRSRVFPGLWLHVDGFWKDDGALLFPTLQAGLNSPEHAEFVAKLQRHT